MDKVAICFDLLSGFLVAIDIAAPSWGQKIGKWLMRRLPEPNDIINPLQTRTLLSSLFLTLLTFLILIIFAIFKDTGTGTTLKWSTVGLFILGVIFGVIFILFVSVIILWLRRTYARRHGTIDFLLDIPIFSSPTTKQDADLLRRIWPFFLILGILALLLLSFATGSRVFLAGPILTFILAVWIFPTAMLWSQSFANYVTSNPEKPAYALARIGLLIFIISKIVHLINLIM